MNINGVDIERATTEIVSRSNSYPEFEMLFIMSYGNIIPKYIKKRLYWYFFFKSHPKLLDKFYSGSIFEIFLGLISGIFGIFMSCCLNEFTFGIIFFLALNLILMAFGYIISNGFNLYQIMLSRIKAYEVYITGK